MITIAEAADRIGEYIGKQSGLKSEVKKICYGVECLLIILLSMTIILGLGWLCGVLREIALIVVTAFLMKHVIGGPHLSGFLRCTGLSALLFVSAAWLIKIGVIFSPWWSIGLAVLGSAAVFLYGPMLSQDFNFSKEQLRTRKILGVFILVFLAVLNIWCHNLSSTALLTGSLLMVMLRVPCVVLLVRWVEQITKGKEVQSG